MPPKVEDDLDKLKTARSNKKRAVTVSYNILERKDILGTGNIDQATYDRLKTEFSIFTASHDDYMSAIEKTDNHEDNVDWKTSVYDVILLHRVAVVIDLFLTILLCGALRPIRKIRNCLSHISILILLL